MKKITLILSILFLLIAVNTCTGPEGPAGPSGKDGEDGKDGTMEKQIRIPFWTGGTCIMLDGNNKEYINISISIIKFNINNYIDVDSVIFVADINAFVYDNYFPADLFNLTDSIAIMNSSIKTKSSSREIVETGNIFNSLPKKEIDIGIRLRTLNIENKNWVVIWRAWLILYRK